MSKKQDYILNYIKKLEPETKISIRNIADTLAVSEGTAYKAIKRAEELKLVRTRPRAGTIRIKDEAFVQNESLTLKKLIRQFGLSIITGKEDDTPLSSIIIGDGSTEQLFKEASGASGARLCLSATGRRNFPGAAPACHRRSQCQSEYPDNRIPKSFVYFIFSPKQSSYSLFTARHTKPGQTGYCHEPGKRLDAAASISLLQ